MGKSQNNHKYIHTSLTRKSDLEKGFSVEEYDRKEWKNGDFVVCEITKIGGSTVRAELTNGRMMQLMEGDLLIGALGVRHATLEATGSWEAVESDGKMHMLTGAGLLGKLISRSVFVTPLIEIKYKGHVVMDGKCRNMQDYVPKTVQRVFDIPVILFVGTSMSSGKTTSARIIARQLKQMGLKVTGAKLTGAGRYRDILSIKDAGADYVIDFVDAGLPSSICPSDQYSRALEFMLSEIQASQPDVAVIEIGASPLEPYNGDQAIEAIRDNIKCTVLCASDPYAVLGVMQSFDLLPTIVSGPAVNTLGGVELVKKLCGVDALNLIEKKNIKAVQKILLDKLNLKENHAKAMTIGA